MNGVTIEMVLQMLGEKNVEVRILGAQLAAAQAKIAELEKKDAPTEEQPAS